MKVSQLQLEIAQNLGCGIFFFPPPLATPRALSPFPLSVSCGIISFPFFTSKPASGRCLSGPGKPQTQALGADLVLLDHYCCLQCTVAPNCLQSRPSHPFPRSTPLGLLLWEKTPKICPVPTPCTDTQPELGQSDTQHGPTDQKSSGSEVCWGRSAQSDQETLLLRLRGGSTSYTGEFPSREINSI